MHGTTVKNASDWYLSVFTIAKRYYS